MTSTRRCAAARLRAPQETHRTAAASESKLCLLDGKYNNSQLRAGGRQSKLANANLALVSPEPPEQPKITQIRRPGRAYIGWMPPQHAQVILQSGSADPAAVAAASAKIRQAQLAVASRPAGVNQDDLIRPAPADLADHVRALRESPAAQPYYAEGWQVALVDLTRVCGCQPLVVSDQAAARVAAINPEDIGSIAAVTLPLTLGEPVPVSFDPGQRAWTVVSPNHNLRIAGLAGPQPVPQTGEMLVPPEGTVLGFAVASMPSFMQVGRFHGRHFLRDGYHRALGLLDRGITVAPAFVREISAFEELFPDPRKLLPQEAYLGDRPPVLADLLSDLVSAAVEVPATQKVILVSGMEFPLAG